MYIVVFIGGLLLGVLISACLFVKKLAGTLLVTQSDEEGPYLSLALDYNVSDISKRKYVTMRIRKINTGYYE